MTPLTINAPNTAHDRYASAPSAILTTMTTDITTGATINIAACNPEPIVIAAGGISLGSYRTVSFSRSATKAYPFQTVVVVHAVIQA